VVLSILKKSSEYPIPTVYLKKSAVLCDFWEVAVINGIECTLE